MAAQGLTPKVQDLVVTTLLKTIGQTDFPLRVSSAKTKLTSMRYYGDELVIEPLTMNSPHSARQSPVSNL
jgi:hypothetical protein